MKNEADVRTACESYLEAWESMKNGTRSNIPSVPLKKHANQLSKNKPLLTNELEKALSNDVAFGLRQSWTVPNTIPPLSSQELNFLRAHSVNDIIKSKKLQRNHILINFIVSTLTHIINDLTLEMVSDESDGISSETHNGSNRSPANIEDSSKINPEIELMKKQTYDAAKKQAIEIVVKQTKEKIINPDNAKFFTKSIRFTKNNYKFLNEIYKDATLHGMMDGALNTAKDILVSKLPDIAIKLTSYISTEELALLAAKRIGGSIINLFEPTLISSGLPIKVDLTPEVLDSYKNAVNNLLNDMLNNLSTGPALVNPKPGF